jgi:uncharacterized RDD family membrane protein YckC
MPDGNPHYAGFWRRVGALFIDAIVINLAMLAIGTVLPVHEAIDLDAPESALGIFFAFQYNTLGTILVILLGWLYYAAMESSARQATLGKMALSLAVTDLAGERIGFGRASGRYFGKFLSWLTLLVGFFMAGFTRRKQALHDILAKTLVISRL